MEEQKPEYRFEYKIVDWNKNETVLTGSVEISSIKDDGSCESIEMNLFSDLRAFKSTIREKYEKENYQTKETEDAE